MRNIGHRKVVHKVIFDAFPCSSLVHEVLHIFSSTECSVVYAGFLVRVLFEVHLCGSLALPFCVIVLIVGSFRYMRVYIYGTFTHYALGYHTFIMVCL